MRVSVSDILTFRQCPAKWLYTRKYAPPTVSPALSIGTAIHKEIEQILTQPPGDMGDLTDKPYLKALSSNDLHALGNIRKQYTLVAVEKPFEWEFRGHTILGRPDGLLRRGSGEYMLWQIKSAAANKSHHVDLVACSPHEIVYAAALNELLDTKYKIDTTLVCRYIKTTTPRLYIDSVIHNKSLVTPTLDSIARTLAEMELYAQASDAPVNTEKCIDWITGIRCPFIYACHNPSVDPSALYGPTVDRYSDLYGIPLSGGSGDSPKSGV